MKLELDLRIKKHSDLRRRQMTDLVNDKKRE